MLNETKNSFLNVLRAKINYHLVQQQPKKKKKKTSLPFKRKYNISGEC